MSEWSKLGQKNAQFQADNNFLIDVVVNSGGDSYQLRCWYVFEWGSTNHEIYYENNFLTDTDNLWECCKDASFQVYDKIIINLVEYCLGSDFWHTVFSDADKAINWRPLEYNADNGIRFVAGTGDTDSDFLTIICHPHRRDTIKTNIEMRVSLPDKWKSLDSTFSPSVFLEFTDEQKKLLNLYEHAGASVFKATTLRKLFEKQIRKLLDTKKTVEGFGNDVPSWAMLGSRRFI
jgi:hypothetical protein